MHVVDVGADAELAGQRVLELAERPRSTVLSGAGDHHGLSSSTNSSPAEAEERLGGELEVALDVELALLAGHRVGDLAEADRRRRLDVAADAGERVEADADLDVVVEDLDPDAALGPQPQAGEGGDVERGRRC